ncbi:unnamed protein product [Brassica napus]|uniref:(rape) hypothetical protein n=1 Tax=Brassica napus TaxID=3708 RepID=A0A816JYZ3_BRANA|nr:unnamed protein product [Brassica napus]
MEKTMSVFVSFPPSTEYVISKSGGGQLDLLNLDTSFKTLETIEFPCTKKRSFRQNDSRV